MPAELTISYGEVTLRLLLTALLCGIVGLEREIRDQPAGFRTHILLGLGAALFTLVSAYGFAPFTRASLEGAGGLQFDPTRIAAQIVTGVGFLGAGAIIRQGGDVRGLTTAGSLWAVAAVGTAAGAGYLFGAAAATAVIIATLFGLRYLRSAVVSRFGLDYADLTVQSSRDITPGQITEILKRHGISIRNISSEVSRSDAVHNIQIRVSARQDIHTVLLDLSDLPGVERSTISGLNDTG